MTGRLVIQRSKKLDGKGYLWGEMLADKGWNELSDEKKIGRVVAYYTDGTVDVHFDALNYTSEGIFQDELWLTGGQGT